MTVDERIAASRRVRAAVIELSAAYKAYQAASAEHSPGGFLCVGDDEVLVFSAVGSHVQGFEQVLISCGVRIDAIPAPKEDE